MAALPIRRGNSHAEDIERGKKLVNASNTGNESELIELLNGGVSVNADEYVKSLFYASKNYVTPLQVASAEGRAKCLELLIDKGADLNARDRFDVTAVHMAAENGHYACLKLLLDAGAECCVPTKYSKKGCYTAHPHPGGTTPLHLAAARNHIDCVRELIQFGADYNAVDEKGRTSLYIAAELRLEDCVLAHLHNAIGKDILSLPGFETGDTPLHFCVMHGSIQCVAKLLKHGSDVNLRNCSGFSPLHYSVLWNLDTKRVAYKILKLLVLKGYNCDINLPDYAGQTALHYVSFNDGGRCVRRPHLASFLIALGANTQISNQRCYSLIQSEMRISCQDLTILSAIAKSSLHLPPLSSLSITPPPPPPLNNPFPSLPSYFIRPNVATPPFNNAGRQMENIHLPDRPSPNVSFHGVRIIRSNGVGAGGHAPPPTLPQLAYHEEGFQPMGGQGFFPHHFHVHNHNDEPDDPNTPQGHELQPGSKVKVEWQNKFEWYKSLCANPRSLQHYCRYAVRKSMGYKRLRHIKDLPVPTSIQHYLLLKYDEFK